MTCKCYLVPAALTLFLFAGCSGNPVRLELDYGTSYRLAKSGQILNPGAEKNLEPVYGIGPEASKAIRDRYIKSFEKTVKEPSPTNYLIAN